MQSITNSATLNKPDVAIQVSGLTKKYGKATAVDRLDLTIPRGTVFGLLGLFSPLVVLSAIQGVDYFVDLPVSGEMLFLRVCNASLLVGVAGFVLGCFWYLNQRYES